MDAVIERIMVGLVYVGLGATLAFITGLIVGPSVGAEDEPAHVYLMLGVLTWVGVALVLVLAFIFGSLALGEL